MQRAKLVSSSARQFKQFNSIVIFDDND